MSLVNTHIRRGPTSQVFNVTAGTAITPGAPVWWNGTTLKQVGGAAANLVTTWVDEMTSRRLVTPRFVGIADFNKHTKEDHDQDITVMSNAVYLMKCASATFKAGDLVGFSKDASNNYLDTENVERVFHPWDAMGVVVEDASTAVTEVQVLVLNAYDIQTSLRPLVNHWSIFAETLQTADDILADYEWQTLTRLVGCSAIVHTDITTGASTITFKKGTTSLQDTLSIAVGVKGTSARVDFDNSTDTDASPPNIDFEIGDDFDISNDATPAAGAAMLNLEYYHPALIA